MVDTKACEPPYLMKILENFKNELDDSYNFIISRMNVLSEVEQYRRCILKDKKNILIMLSDEAGIKPYFLNELHLVFRTYNRKDLYDNEKIFPIPCGYSCGYSYDHHDATYLTGESDKKLLIEKKQRYFFFRSSFSYAS